MKQLSSLQIRRPLLSMLKTMTTTNPIITLLRIQSRFSTSWIPNHPRRAMRCKSQLLMSWVL
jgi:hypothetical protein